MTQQDFIEAMRDILRTDEDIQLDTELCDLEGWDSMAMINVIDFADEEYSVSLEVDDFKVFETIGDIYARLEN